MTHLHRTWFVHLQGESFGPLSTDVVVLMIQQKRLEYWDFIWTQGLDAWARIADMMPFSEMLPPYPEAPIPGAAGEGTIPNPTQAKDAMAIPITPPAPDPSHAKTPPPPPQEVIAETKPAKKEPPRGIRRHGRKRLVGTVVIDGYQTYELYDVAEGGIFAVASPPIPVGTSVKFKMQSNVFPKPLNMTGIVIRFGKTEEGKEGFGIQFTRVNPAYSRIIRDYVSHEE